jgi:hypothetical protein
MSGRPLRTPLAFLEQTRRVGRHAEEALKAMIQKYEALGAIVPDEGPAAPNYFADTLKLSIEPPADGSEKVAVRAEVKSARTVWISAESVSSSWFVDGRPRVAWFTSSY